MKVISESESKLTVSPGWAVILCADGDTITEGIDPVLVASAFLSIYLVQAIVRDQTPRDKVLSYVTSLYKCGGTKQLF